MDTNTICLEINAMLDRLTYVNSSMNINKSICEALDAPQEKEIILQDFNFWQTVLENCTYRALSELSKVYDNHKDAVGIIKVINQAEQIKWENRKHKKRLVEDAKRQYESVASIRDKLVILRDNGLAHSDKSCTINLRDFVTAHRVSKTEIKKLIDTAENICNGFLVEFTGEGRTIVLALNDDARHIIADLKYAKETREKQHHTLMKILQEMADSEELP